MMPSLWDESACRLEVGDTADWKSALRASCVAKNLLHDPARLAIGNAFFLAVVEINQLGVVEAEKVQERGVVIIRAHRIDRGLVAKLVGFAINHAAFEAATCDPRAETLAVVVAPCFLCRAMVLSH